MHVPAKRRTPVEATANLTWHANDFLLAGNGLKPFSDERLIDYWTYQPLPETLYYEHMPDGQPAFANSTRTLWVSCRRAVCMAVKMAIHIVHALSACRTQPRCERG